MNSESRVKVNTRIAEEMLALHSPFSILQTNIVGRHV